METKPLIPHKTEMKSKRVLIAVSVVLILAVTSILVLKFIPLKYEELHNISGNPSASGYIKTLHPQQTDTKWIIVPKGYTASVTYSVTSNNPVNLTVTSQSPTTYLNFSVCQEQGVSGSFSFKADTSSLDNKYYLSLQNPAPSNFFEIGTITASVQIKVSGWTTFL
jgi:hypothetical protein